MTPPATSLRNLRDNLDIEQPKDLAHFLTKFGMILPPIQGKPDLIKRVAKEFCEDAALNGVAYTEARYAPSLMAKDEVTSDHVVRAVNQGFEEGEEEFGVKVRSILCIISALPFKDNQEVLDLCKKYKGEGVVGMDMAGNENSSDFGAKEKELFEEAKKSGIHRTVHAGEDGPAANVQIALDQLHAERIGHGYHVMDDPELYQRCQEERVHFEVCPSSSILTNSVPASRAATFQHPLLNFVKDGVNFSINTDDPTVTGTQMSDEIELVRSWGLSEAHIVRAQFNAARSSFLPENEKRDLIKQLEKVYGMSD